MASPPKRNPLLPAANKIYQQENIYGHERNHQKLHNPKLDLHMREISCGKSRTAKRVHEPTKKSVNRQRTNTARPSCRKETIAKLLEIADGAVVATTFKYDGKFENQVDKRRVKEFMDVVRSVR